MLSAAPHSWNGIADEKNARGESGLGAHQLHACIETDSTAMHLDEDDLTSTWTKSHKRNASSTPDFEPNKMARMAPFRSSRPRCSEALILKYLLSDEGANLCRPDEEVRDLAYGANTVTYSCLLEPFEELMCAVILSRPISHRLGLRSIRTILNAPYCFTNADAIRAAGSAGVKQAVWAAHTLHKQKTAEEIEGTANVVLQNQWGGNLESVRKLSHMAVDKEREMLRAGVHGLGDAGLDIFFRRIQWLWKEAYPFMDMRAKGSVELFGLPKEAHRLVALIHEHWGDLDFAGEVAYDEEARKRRAFVLVLDRAVSAELEKKTGRVLEKTFGL